MNILRKALLESTAVLFVGLSIVGLMMFAFGQNASAFGA